MRQLLSCVLCCALVMALAVPGRAEDKREWATIKGSVVLPKGTKIPERAKLNVTVDKPHCLGKGDILDESIIVNDKNRGIKNVVVYLRPDDKTVDTFGPAELHPDDAKRKPAEVVIDQPCCMFVNRVTCARVGDTIVVKNPAPVAHNFYWSSANNGEYNPTLAAKSDWKMPKALVKESGPLPYKCSIHGWMSGTVRIFDHPYFAVTDADGKFEIKNAPVGKYRIVYWHESVGLRGGKDGRFGEQIEIKGPTLEMKATDFDVVPAAQKN